VTNHALIRETVHPILRATSAAMQQGVLNTMRLLVCYDRADDRSSLWYEALVRHKSGVRLHRAYA
jgi:hypothetical protein